MVLSGFHAFELIVIRFIYKVDLKEETEVTCIATQGRPTNIQWPTKYQIAYSSEGNDWKYFEYNNKVKVAFPLFTFLFPISFPEQGMGDGSVMYWGTASRPLSTIPVSFFFFE